MESFTICPFSIDTIDVNQFPFFLNGLWPRNWNWKLHHQGSHWMFQKCHDLYVISKPKFPKQTNQILDAVINITNQKAYVMLQIEAAFLYLFTFFFHNLILSISFFLDPPALIKQNKTKQRTHIEYYNICVGGHLLFVIFSWQRKNNNEMDRFCCGD